MNINPSEIRQRDRYKITTGVILPRPIAWVSTQDGDGRLNVAPYSFFTAASTNPLTLLFCPQIPAPGEQKDTLRNIEATGQFVVNIVDEETAEAMNQTATGLPAGQSEFEFAGLTPAASQMIAVPRVAESPVAFECVLDQIVVVGENQPGAGAVVFGRVQNIYMRDDVYVDSYIQLDKLRPIGRLMGNLYCHINDMFELIRR